MTTGQRLADLRRKAGLTQKQLETRCGIDRTYISQIEQGRIVQPEVETLRRFAAALGVPVSSLLPDGEDVEVPTAARVVDDLSADELLEAYVRRGLERGTIKLRTIGARRGPVTEDEIRQVVEIYRTAMPRLVSDIMAAARGMTKPPEEP